MTAGGLRLCRSSRAQACGAAPGCGRGSGCASSEASLVGSANLPVPRKQDKGLRWLTRVRRPLLLASPMGTSRFGAQGVTTAWESANQDRTRWRTARRWPREGLGDSCRPRVGCVPRDHRRDVLAAAVCPERPARKPPADTSPDPRARSRLAAHPSAPTPQLWRKAGQAAETSEC